MDIIKAIAIVMAAIIVLVLIGSALNYAGLVNYQFFAPKYEAARRNVFEETKSYQDGLRRDFDNLYLSYLAAKSPDEKAAILSVIRHRAAGINPDFLPDNIRDLMRGN